MCPALLSPGGHLLAFSLSSAAFCSRSAGSLQFWSIDFTVSGSYSLRAIWMSLFAAWPAKGEPLIPICQILVDHLVVSETKTNAKDLVYCKSKRVTKHPLFVILFMSLCQTTRCILFPLGYIWHWRTWIISQLVLDSLENKRLRFTSSLCIESFS
jgi:hypothetical protein